jgi:hypothetical protein
MAFCVDLQNFAGRAEISEYKGLAMYAAFQNVSSPRVLLHEKRW